MLQHQRHLILMRIGENEINQSKINQFCLLGRLLTVLYSDQDNGNKIGRENKHDPKPRIQL